MSPVPRTHWLELRLPPLLLLVLLGAAMAAVARWLPGFALALPGRSAVAAALIVAGAGFALAGVIAFRRARTTVNPTRPESTSAVVASGVYRLSRNPMYVGMLAVLVGVAWWLGNALVWLAPPLFLVYMARFQIAPEERALVARFGEDYSRYMRAVRRWL